MEEIENGYRFILLDDVLSAKAVPLVCLDFFIGFQRSVTRPQTAPREAQRMENVTLLSMLHPSSNNSNSTATVQPPPPLQASLLCQTPSYQNELTALAARLPDQQAGSKPPSRPQGIPPATPPRPFHRPTYALTIIFSLAGPVPINLTLTPTLSSINST